MDSYRIIVVLLLISPLIKQTAITAAGNVENNMLVLCDTSFLSGYKFLHVDKKYIYLYLAYDVVIYLPVIFSSMLAKL